MFQDLWGKLRGRGVTPPLPAHLVVLLPETDDDQSDGGGDGPPSYGAEPIAGLACIIIYRDAKGQLSQRRVSCQRLDLAGGVLYLCAHCHERQARRTFRIDRIESVIDLHTGEVIDDPGSFFSAYRVDTAQQSGLSWGLSPRQKADLVAGLNALVFMGKCDREWHPLERALVEHFVASYWIRSELAGEPPLSDIVRHADRLSPDAETFFVALGRCAENRVLAAIIRRHLQSVVDADCEHRREELYWGSAVDDYFRRLSDQPHALE